MLEGRRVTGPPPGMAVVFQEYGRSLFPWLTVWQNVELPLKEKGLPKEKRRRLVDGGAGGGRAARRPPRLPVAAVRRHAAAGRDRPRDRLRAAGAADGRAVRRGRRADPRRPGGPGPRRCGGGSASPSLFVTHDIDESVYLGQRVIVLSGLAHGRARAGDHRPAGRAGPAHHPVAAAVRRAALARLRADPAGQARPPAGRPLTPPTSPSRPCGRIAMRMPAAARQVSVAEPP